ncbi:phosphotransferase enzyme family [Fusarium mundagurra]|uniref:Phosphotransferase enzyme family n=1 Tax=Fusarium mundagurra TaxID=1567541 RepID=A0A8H5YFG6_9HYPO|nr:phosphotransferase enzyme family [Fusarium mundagurra]
MLSAIVQRFRMRWVSFFAYFSSFWDQLLQLSYSFTPQAFGDQNLSNNAKNEVHTPELSKSATDTSASSIQFPAVTEDQSIQARRAFIESLDLSTIYALASKYNNNKSCRVVNKASRSFNVCFFVELAADESHWVVRIPIEPAVNNPWHKFYG